MKVRNRITRAAAFMLTLAMLLSLLPAQVLAAGEFEADVIFKNISLYSAVNHRPVSISYNTDITREPADNLPRNYLYTPTTVSRDEGSVNPLEWMLLAYSIQYSQDVDLELYRLNEGAAEWEDQLPIEPETLITKFDNDPSAIEDFLGERLGYLKVYPYTGNYDGPDGEGFYTYVPYTQEDLFSHVDSVVNGDGSSAELKEYKAIGFLGQPLIHEGTVDPQAEEEANSDEILDENGEVPPEADEEGEAPPEADEEEAPPTDDTQDEEVTPPTEAEPDTQPEEPEEPEAEPDTQPEEPEEPEAQPEPPESEPENGSEPETAENGEPFSIPSGNIQIPDDDETSDESGSEPAEGNANGGDAGEPAEDNSDGGDASGEPAENNSDDGDASGEPAEDSSDDGDASGEPVEDNVEDTGDADEPADSDTTGEPEDDNNAADEPEEPEIPEEVPPEPVLYADAPSMEGKIQNFSVWGGELSDNPDFQYDDGYYVIVLTPKDEQYSVYNSFMCFRVDSSFDPNDILWPDEYPQLEQVFSIDPVNLLTGSFSWSYTDMSVYGSYDLPFTRMYESTDSERDHGLGLGWSSDYTVELKVDTLYAKVTLPGGKDIFFDVYYDGSFRAKSGSAFTFQESGSGYTLSHRDGTVYYFNADGQLEYVSFLDGNYYDLQYSGGKLASVTNPSGTLSFSWNGEHISSVSDDTGRSVALTYSGDYLVSATNTDGDTLYYEYGDNGCLTQITNFNGEVYVTNSYDSDRRVLSQYLKDEGNFSFSYDDSARCQRQFEIVRKRRRNFVVFRQGG